MRTIHAVTVFATERTSCGKAVKGQGKAVNFKGKAIKSHIKDKKEV